MAECPIPAQRLLDLGFVENYPPGGAVRWVIPIKAGMPSVTLLQGPDGRWAVGTTESDVDGMMFEFFRNEDDLRRICKPHGITLPDAPLD